MDAYNRESPSAPPPPQYRSHGARPEAFARPSVVHLEALTGISRASSIHPSTSAQPRSSYAPAHHNRTLASGPLVSVIESGLLF